MSATSCVQCTTLFIRCRVQVIRLAPLSRTSTFAGACFQDRSVWLLFGKFYLTSRISVHNLLNKEFLSNIISVRQFWRSTFHCQISLLTRWFADKRTRLQQHRQVHSFGELSAKHRRRIVLSAKWPQTSQCKVLSANWLSANSSVSKMFSYHFDYVSQQKDYTIGTLHYNWISHAHVCACITGLQHVQCTDSVIMPSRHVVCTTWLMRGLYPPVTFVPVDDLRMLWDYMSILTVNYTFRENSRYAIRHFHYVPWSYF